MAVVLLISTNSEQVTEVPLLGKLTIGRSSKSDICVDDKLMSGKHGYFDLNAKGQILYCDLDSTNGSYLNNNKIQNTLFKVNDVIKIGNTTITIDQSKLSNKESIIIGKSKSQDSDNLTLPPLNMSNKSIKSDAPLQASSEKANKKLIEQEESSGNTKHLKLNTKKAKKK